MAATVAGSGAAEVPSSLLLVVGGECGCRGLLAYVLEELERGRTGPGTRCRGGGSGRASRPESRRMERSGRGPAGSGGGGGPGPYPLTVRRRAQAESMGARGGSSVRGRAQLLRLEPGADRGGDTGPGFGGPRDWAAWATAPLPALRARLDSPALSSLDVLEGGAGIGRLGPEPRGPLSVAP